MEKIKMSSQFLIDINIIYYCLDIIADKLHIHKNETKHKFKQNLNRVLSALKPFENEIMKLTTEKVDKVDNLKLEIEKYLMYIVMLSKNGKKQEFDNYLMKFFENNNIAIE